MANGIDNFTENRGFFVWKPEAWLRVTGDDAAAFLQGQLTNDLRGLGATGAVYGLWLNHKGRVLADSFVLRAGPKDFWVGSYFSGAAELRERLEAFVVADDVVIEDRTAEWMGVTLLGEAGEWSAVASDVLGEVGGVEFAGRRASAPVREWVFPLVGLARVRASLAGSRELGAAEMERRRIAARIPSVPMDLGLGDLPNEGGLDVDAVSYTKGCYLGQEVMARLKSMGQVRRRLLRGRGAGAVPALPAEVFQGGRKVGELRTAVPAGEEAGGGFVGLALVSLLNLQADRPLSFSAESGAGEFFLIDAP